MKMYFTSGKGLCLIFAFTIIAILTSSCSSNKRSGAPRILVFSKTAGFHHSSIKEGNEAIFKMAKENGIEMDTTTHGNFFTDKNLEKYAAVVFLNTTGDVLDAYQQIAFERYIQSGGGFVGVHAATDTEYGWQWYGKLVGAYFNGHPAGLQTADFKVKNQDHEMTAMFTDSVWNATDEIYNFKNINPDLNILLTVDESTYEGGTNGDFHPISWYHDFEGGRSFYTNFGHTAEMFSNDIFLQHFWAGLQYAMNKNQQLDRSLAQTNVPPEGSRFLKNALSIGRFYEPTEMTILPNHDILIAERRGHLLMYQRATDSLFQVGYLDVYFKTNIPKVNAEEGLMGLQKDPNFEQNHWLYAFYSPTGEEWVNRLSRFKFEDDTLKLETEQIIMDVGSQREICCHTGGSIAFGGDGLLYLSTGDNSTPFDEPDVEYVNNGFAPLNDLPGKKQYDARRSSGNTNDLRGKILRIKVNEDGSYDIPEGNLFPVGMEKTRPEIYTMGHRNPYRISVDPKKGYVYWGEVGPDAQKDDLAARGPRGYDEMGQAREAGNFGWPLFIADNQPYKQYNYATGESGDFFDPQRPVNNSKNNTGLEILPPAQPAYVFYPYVKSDYWSGVMSGGRNAMAGPVWYKDLYTGPHTLPDYYDSKVIIYDWMRGWMKAVSLFDDGRFNRIEPFAPDIDLNNLIDMELGPDGTIYLLEYGTGWFSKNDDSGLSFISFHEGNMPPKVEDLMVDKLSGQPPLNISAQIKATDLEATPMTYIWNFGDGRIEETTDTILSHTYDSIGTFKLTIKVKDADGATTQGPGKTIVCGNTRPEVDIEIAGGNESFFIPGQPINYNISVYDEEDSKTQITTENIFVEVDYMEGFDEAMLDAGHQEGEEGSKGEALILTSTCKTCHSDSPESIGPNYVDVAEKYKDDEDAVTYLQGKMIAGGTGVWGENVMPANASLTKQEAWHISKYIMSLASETDEDAMPPKGTITANKNQADKTMVITAKYKDNGTDRTKPLVGVKRVMLQSNTMTMAKAKDLDGFSAVSFGELDLLVLPAEAGHFSMENIDLTGIKSVVVAAGWQSPPASGISLNIRLGSVDGEIIGSGNMSTPQPNTEGGIIPILLNEKANVKTDKIFFTYSPNEEESLGANAAALVSVTFSGE